MPRILNPNDPRIQRFLPAHEVEERMKAIIEEAGLGVAGTEKIVIDAGKLAERAAVKTDIVKYDCDAFYAEIHGVATNVVFRVDLKRPMERETVFEALKKGLGTYHETQEVEIWLEQKPPDNPRALDVWSVWVKGVELSGANRGYLTKLIPDRWSASLRR